MIEFAQVAELVDDDVIGERRRDERETVVEAHCPLLRTAPPSGSLISYADTREAKLIECVPVRETFVHQKPRTLFVQEVLPSTRRSTACSFSRHLLHRADDRLDELKHELQYRDKKIHDEGRNVEDEGEDEVEEIWDDIHTICSISNENWPL